MTAVKVETYKLSRRTRFLQRRLSARMTCKWMVASVKASPRHPVKTYRQFRSAEAELSREIQRRFFFGGP